MNYIVFCQERGQGQDDGRTFAATTPADAAEQWALHEDCFESGEDAIANGQDVTVTVFDGDTARRFIVSGESVPSYRARLIHRAEDT